MAVSTAIDRAAGLLGIGSLETCSLEFLAAQAKAYLQGCGAYWPDEDECVYFEGGYEGVSEGEWARMLAAATIINARTRRRR